AGLLHRLPVAAGRRAIALLAGLLPVTLRRTVRGRRTAVTCLLPVARRRAEPRLGRRRPVPLRWRPVPLRGLLRRSTVRRLAAGRCSTTERVRWRRAVSGLRRRALLALRRRRVAAPTPPRPGTERRSERARVGSHCAAQRVDPGLRNGRRERRVQ